MRLPIRPSIFIALLLVAIFSGHIWGSSRQPDVPNATAYDNTQEMLKKVGEDVVSQVDDYEATTKIWAAENSEKGTPVSVKGYDFRIASSN
ncbi:MAG TPA: hypothetical protein VLA92_04245, partial [Candidatus Saccharimonadales bacterium]|nr:hypothetical protein [Candidatus Saccharimonadales bacterium]